MITRATSSLVQKFYDSQEYPLVHKRIDAERYFWPFTSSAPVRVADRGDGCISVTWKNSNARIKVYGVDEDENILEMEDGIKVEIVPLDSVPTYGESQEEEESEEGEESEDSNSDEE